MMIVFISILLALLLLAVMVRVLSQSGQDLAIGKLPQTPRTLFDQERVSRELHLGERIFSGEDLKYIANVSPVLRREFIRERRRLALDWITRRIVFARRCMQFHRYQTRLRSDLDPIVELRLAWNYTIFLTAVAFARSLIWLRNPFTAGAIISWIITVGERLQPAGGGEISGVDTVLS